MSWSEGDWVVRREVLQDGPWMGMLVKIIEDRPDRLVSYIPEGAPLAFPPGVWPTPTGKHPWAGRATWRGHGCLMIQPTSAAHAIWHFWEGPRREFSCWYINLQEPFRRTPVGYDTQDLELDIILSPDGGLALKDDHLMEQRVAEGRWTAQRVEAIRVDAQELMARLEAGERWWPLAFRDWAPDPRWVVPEALPEGWASYEGADRKHQPRAKRPPE